MARRRRCVILRGFRLRTAARTASPFPVDRDTYDKTIEIFNKALNRASVDRSEKARAFRRLANFSAGAGSLG